MTIHVHIERLVLDGLPVTHAQGPQVRAAVEAELARWLAERGLAPGLAQGGAAPSVLRPVDHARRGHQPASHWPADRHRHPRRARDMNHHTLDCSSKRAVGVPSFHPVRSGLLQRKCGCGRHTPAGGECGACHANWEEAPKPDEENLAHDDAFRSVHDALRTPGRPMDPAVRAPLEARFGRDFSGVRIHTDARAVESARAVDARAYTVGKDVVFGGGEHCAGDCAWGPTARTRTVPCGAAG